MGSRLIARKWSRPLLVGDDKIPVWSLAEFLVATGLADSKSEARRLIRQGAVKVDGVTVKEA